MLRAQTLHAVQCSLRCLNGSSALQITKHAGSVSCSECLTLVTAITFIDIMVFGLRLDLCISNSLHIFSLIRHFISLIITIGFYIIFPSDSSSIFLNKYLTIPPLPSLPTLYPIPQTQSAVNTQFPHSLPFPSHPLSNPPLPFPSHPLSNPPNTICCQNTIPHSLPFPPSI